MKKDILKEALRQAVNGLDDNVAHSEDEIIDAASKLINPIELMAHMKGILHSKLAPMVKASEPKYERQMSFGGIQYDALYNIGEGNYAKFKILNAQNLDLIIQRKHKNARQAQESAYIADDVLSPIRDKCAEEGLLAKEAIELLGLNEDKEEAA